MPNVFFCRKIKGKNWEKKTFRSTSGTFFHFDDSCWLNTVRMPSDRGSKNNWLFWFLPIYFGFFRTSFGSFFRFFLQILGHLQKTFFYKRLFLWSQEKYRYIFVVDIDASARQNIFSKKQANLFRLPKKIENLVFSESKWYFFHFTELMLDDLSSIAIWSMKQRLVHFCSFGFCRNFSASLLAEFGEIFFRFLSNFVTILEIFFRRLYLRA